MHAESYLCKEKLEKKGKLWNNDAVQRQKMTGDTDNDKMSAFFQYEHEVVNGDCLEVLKKIPSNSVSLILTDPPYHSTKKANIIGDCSFVNDEAYLQWITLLAIEWKRILKKNGALFCFCSSKMAALIEYVLSSEFNILSQIVWTKPNEPGFDGWKQKMDKTKLRQWYAHSERAIFAEPSYGNTLGKSYFSILLREARKKSNLSGHALTEKIGAYGKVNHGGAVSNWEAGRNTPSRDQYEKIREVIRQIGEADELPPYEDAVRPFLIDSSKQYTDIWDYPSVRPYQGKHPAEKPLSMLKDIITATTFPESLVLDCFAGSGSTAIAALLTGRKSYSIEIDPDWVGVIRTRLELLQKASSNNRQFINNLCDVDGLKKGEFLFS